MCRVSRSSVVLCPLLDVQVIFVGFVVYFMYHIIVKIRKEKRQYFKGFWNCLELCTMIMSILAIVMYAMKIIMGNTAMNVLKEAGTGTFLNFSLILMLRFRIR
jgi:hypothetical protein